MQFQILDAQGDVINTIVADEAFLEVAYPGRYRLDPNWSPPPPPPQPSMEDLRQAAFAAALEAGNKMTSTVTRVYTDAEMRTWPIQEQEARDFAAGKTLPDWALLPALAADRGAPIAVYAAGIIRQAD